MAFPAPGSQLYRWQRLTTAARPKPNFDSDNVEHWIKRVEQASRFAVSEAFSLKKSAYRQRPRGPAMDLETVEQLQDHDEAYAEAQELLNDWMNSKLRLELESDQEENAGDAAADSTPAEETPAGFLKYEKFDDLCGYLEQEMESSTVQDFLQNLLQNEVVDSGILEDLRIEEIKEKKKTRDPRITMELRHKQVKENCLRRQKEVELRRREKILKKLALAEAKQRVQEENKRQALKARKEEEEIQREMVKLRKKMAEKRHILGEARRIERKRQELEQAQKLTAVGLSHTTPKPLKQEKEEKQRRLQELLSKIYSENQRCLQQHFSAWYKFILDHRIKMGKARALADWKCQLKALRAWRDYTWVQKLEQETEQLETHLRDQNRKKQLAIEHNRKQVLRCCFIEWQLWSRAEAEKRELQLRQEETRKKMAQLLEAASVGKLGTDGSWDVGRTRMRQVTPDQPVRQERVTETALLQEEPINPVEPCCRDAGQTPSLRSCKKPKYAWQVTLQHAAVNSQDHAEFSNRTVSPIQWFGAPGKKVAPAFSVHFEHRHAFQQQLIEEQRRQLQEQREVILELQGNQQLRRAKQEAEQATAVTMELNSPVPKTKEKMLKRRDPSSCKSVSSLSSPVPLGPESTKTVTQSRRSSNLLTSAHPILKAMEERAIHRAERRRELEESKRKREEEKLVQLKAEEEERQRKEAAEKEAQLEKRREERRQQKLKELEKQRRLENEHQLLAKARDHYKKVLLRKWGLEPWKRLREQAKENMVAQKHHCSGLQRKYLLAWLWHVQESLTEKMARAEEFSSRMLLRRGFRSWLKYKDYLSALEERASRLYAASLKKKLLWAWFDLLSEEKSALWEKQKIAAEHSDRRITLTMFRAWRQYPALMKEEREKEARREQLRKRVAEILPDFRI
ncbi:coiled-coil domain-containing protein 191 isoform X2 [Gopherus flavomarginatus]|uniref:coiled-coil domain-containing protein 191 isoform X2 n=1 Tax=Gopherus flavomarginatus TaxID=286002 RepID=UPI0021CBA6B8|nr:coiled-coil domain-containing protein 191 isoform X2 [Gopherus flavomarginatus]